LRGGGAFFADSARGAKNEPFGVQATACRHRVAPVCHFLPAAGTWFFPKKSIVGRQRASSATPTARFCSAHLGGIVPYRPAGYKSIIITLRRWFSLGRIAAAANAGLRMTSLSTDMAATSNPEVVYLHPRDNICVAARDLPEGTQTVCGYHAFRLSAPVRFGHKIAVMPIAQDEPVRSTDRRSASPHNP